MLSGQASDVPEAFRAFRTAFMQVDIYSLRMLCSEIKDDLQMGIPVKINGLRIEPTNEVGARLQCGIEKVGNLGPSENPALRECNDLDLDLSAPCTPQRLMLSRKRAWGSSPSPPSHRARRPSDRLPHGSMSR